MMLIYCIRNKINNKKYVGQTTKTLENRICGHLKMAKSGGKNKLSKAIRKYGWENFEVTILCECSTLEELNQKEIEYIEKYNCIKNGYNLALGGNNNIMFSPAVKEKHARTMRSKRVRAKISKTMKHLRETKGFSKQTRERISQACKGHRNYLGKKRPIEAIRKTAEGTYKPVYCLDINFNVVKSFKSVKDAANWAKENLNVTAKCKYQDVIKASYVKKKFYHNYIWIYGEPCVETIENFKKEVE